MDTISTLLILIVSCNLRVVAQFTAGGCTFDDGPAQCDYQQDLYDDFDWTHVSAQEAPYLSTELPQGSYMMVDSSQHDSGEKARIQLPVMKENDTHCIDFNYLLYTKDGSSPGTLNILVKVNKGPLANPIWNVTSFTGRDWLRAELAVSTFWPNEYQVIFEAEVSEGKTGYIAIDDIQVLSYPCDKSPHFLRLGDVEVNAGQNATFQCIATGRDAVNNKLWLQKRNGEDIPVAQTKNINHRRFAASFRLREVTTLDQDLYRCVTQSDRGSGVSNFAQLIVREPPRPIAPPQLLGVGPTYLLIQLNANSIFGDGPIILKEVEYRMTSGSWIEIHAVNAPNYKLWHLDPDTEYEIRVLLTRPGEGGTGQSGPPLITRTKCAGAVLAVEMLTVAMLSVEMLIARQDHSKVAPLATEWLTTWWHTLAAEILLMAITAVAKLTALRMWLCAGSGNAALSVGYSGNGGGTAYSNSDGGTGSGPAALSSIHSGSGCGTAYSSSDGGASSGSSAVSAGHSSHGRGTGHSRCGFALAVVMLPLAQDTPAVVVALHTPVVKLLQVEVISSPLSPSL
ncbi:receptor-type tyrosine-protein phosphatase kappa-like [Polyodon spathula]|uniref:receptor-type tyrosine-protein phosphatase kappa-like n=1 Tax=Polyodon spathula TaxID=7913 RepID=UPI001B7EE126|nr:receptor-type tyrosine-protein phosphatase kappa-like [Polyodon spathula]